MPYPALSQTSLLYGTTAIHGGNDTLSIFRTATDGGGIKQKQV